MKGQVREVQEIIVEFNRWVVWEKKVDFDFFFFFSFALFTHNWEAAAQF